MHYRFVDKLGFVTGSWSALDFLCLILIGQFNFEAIFVATLFRCFEPGVFPLLSANNRPLRLAGIPSLGDDSGKAAYSFFY